MSQNDILWSARSAENYSHQLASKLRAIAAPYGQRRTIADPCFYCGSHTVVTCSSAAMCALCGAER